MSDIAEGFEREQESGYPAEGGFEPEPDYQGYEPDPGYEYVDEAYERDGDDGYAEQREQAIAAVDAQRQEAELRVLERRYPELSEAGPAEAVVKEAMAVAREMGDPDLLEDPEFLEEVYIWLRDEGRLPTSVHSSGYSAGPGPEGAESADPSGVFGELARRQADLGDAGRMFGF